MFRKVRFAFMVLIASLFTVSSFAMPHHLNNNKSGDKHYTQNNKAGMKHIEPISPPPPPPPPYMEP